MDLNGAVEPAAQLPGADVRAGLCDALVSVPGQAVWVECAREAGHRGGCMLPRVFRRCGVA